MRQLGRGTCAYYVTTNDVPEKEQCEIHLISFEAICSFPQLTSGSLTHKWLIARVKPLSLTLHPVLFGCVRQLASCKSQGA